MRKARSQSSPNTLYTPASQVHSSMPIFRILGSSFSTSEKVLLRASYKTRPRMVERKIPDFLSSASQTILPSLSVRNFWTLMNAMCPPRECCGDFVQGNTGDVLSQNIEPLNALCRPCRKDAASATLVLPVILIPASMAVYALSPFGLSSPEARLPLFEQHGRS